MNLVAKSLLISALLLGGAHAAERDAKSSVIGLQSGKGLHKVAAAQPAQSAGKKAGAAQGTKSNLTAEPRDAGKTVPVAKENQDGVTENPSGATEQTVQLGGVRG